jgi:hypothetical protein
MGIAGRQAGYCSRPCNWLRKCFKVSFALERTRQRRKLCRRTNKSMYICCLKDLHAFFPSKHQYNSGLGHRKMVSCRHKPCAPRQPQFCPVAGAPP